MVFTVVRMRSFIYLTEIALVAALIGCGSTSVKKRSNHPKSTIGDVAVEVKLTSKDEVSGLALIDSAEYTAEIVGCKSGLSFPLIDNSVSNVRVLTADRGCVFELKSLVLDAENYDLIGKNFDVGSIFQVVGDHGSKLEFTVISNLENPIEGEQLVRIVYGLVQEGTGQDVDASVNAGIQIEGASPIALEIKKVSLAIDANDGAGLLHVVLECDEDLVAGKCMGIAPADLEAKIAKDSFSGVLNLQQCLAIATQGQALVPVAVGNSVAAHGGGQISQLKGPAPLFAVGNNQLILAVSENADSCKYFEVEILKP